MSENGAVLTLGGGFTGDLIKPQDSSYDEARSVFNSIHDKRPALIARCASTGDVVAAVNFAREQELEVAVRCGAHSVAGMSSTDGGILIDLSGLKRIDVDTQRRTARVGGGVLWGELDAATQEHALHTPGGRVTTTGVGGFTTGGGYGWTSSKYGLACDNLISAEVVLADGRVLRAGEAEHEELLWGIRGGGGNFGVVTEFELQLHELGPIVLAGLAVWALDRAPQVVRAWRDYIEDAPDELSTACTMLTAPPEEFVPDHLRGRPVLGLAAMYVGDPEQGQGVVAPLKDLGPDVDLIQPMPYTAFQAMLDPSFPKGLRNYWRGEYLTGLPDAAVDTYLQHGSELVAAGAPFTQMLIFRIGQAVSTVPDEESAFSHRDARYLFHPISAWQDPDDDERLIAASRAFCDTLAPFSTGASYLNFTPDDRARDGFDTAKYARLVALKDAYDPGNLFHLNQNIKPSRQAGEPVLS